MTAYEEAVKTGSNTQSPLSSPPTTPEKKKNSARRPRPQSLANPACLAKVLTPSAVSVTTRSAACVTVYEVLGNQACQKSPAPSSSRHSYICLSSDTRGPWRH